MPPIVSGGRRGRQGRVPCAGDFVVYGEIKTPAADLVELTAEELGV